MEQLTVSIRQGSDMTSLSLRTIERLVRNGDVRSMKLGRRRLVYVDSLREFLEGKAA